MTGLAPPPIDARTPEQLVAKTEELATRYSGWMPAPGRQDPGSALIRVFARMLGHVIERLNQVPERHHLAFLRLLGASRRPPQAARVPLSFELAPGAASAAVPRGTRVSASEGLPFETERTLTLTSARLTVLRVREPRGNGDVERSRDVDPTSAEPFSAFVGEQPVEHALYLACDALFTQPNASNRSLELTWTTAETELDWSYWDGQQWQSVPTPLPVPSPLIKKEVWPLPLADELRPVPLELQGRTARWLRGVPRLPSTPSLKSVRAQASVKRSNVPPDRVFHNSVALDPSKDLLPFGELPRFNDCFYLLSADALRTGGERPRTLRLQVSWRTGTPWEKVPVTGVTVNLLWEAWTGTGWITLGESDQNGGIGAFDDKTKALTQGGTVVLTLPPTLRETSVNGVPGRWLRVRISEGDYGSPANNTARPPVLQSLTLGYDDTLRPPLEACLSHNDGAWADLTADLARSASITPFQVAPDTTPALYLGFDRPFGELPVSLFLLTESLRPGSPVTAGAPDAPPAPADRPPLRWEYWGQNGWSALPVEDETLAFGRDGLVCFFGPAGQRPSLEFGRTCFWLRARWDSAHSPEGVRLRGVRLDTVWASQVMTVAEEVLGSSSGLPAQTFSAARTPVLEDFRLEVREATWVRWDAVPDFLASTSEDRHYTLEVESGQVRFGDGRQGRIPPVGRDNVRLAYRTGGGASGNVPAGTLTRLDTPLPSVAAVSQPEPATGGADLEPVPLLARRQSLLLRHGGRAVTAEDYEDLAREVSPTIARARALTPTFDPIAQANEVDDTRVDEGLVRLILVTRGTLSELTPELELLRRVEAHVRARCPPATTLQVSGPVWVRLRLEARLVSQQPAENEAVRARAREALLRYLHPLAGGPDAVGWDFCQWPYASSLVALLSRVEGVDHVRSVTLDPPSLSFSHPASLLFVEPSDLTVTFGEKV